MVSAVVFAGTPALANDPCFDGMCNIEYNATTFKTTYTRLSDAEIATRLAFKAEQERLNAIAEANKPKPIVIDTPVLIINPNIVPVDTQTATTPVSTPSINSTTTNTIIPTVETKTAQVDTQTAITQETISVTTTTTNNNSVMVEEWVIEIKRLINQLLALIARLNK